ncbi:MAG: M24 family metallopeptidase, partial [Syntrophorhabdus sp.]
MMEYGTFEKIPESDLRSRINNLRLLMQATGVDFAFIVQNVDRYYFSGTMQKGIVVIPVDKDPFIFIEKGAERARDESYLDVIAVEGQKEMRDVLQSSGILEGVAGMELDVVPVSVFSRLKTTFGLREHHDISDLIKKVRLIKSEFELDQIRRSGAMLSRVFARARDEVREGRSELEIEASLVAEGRIMGHQGFLRMRGLNQEMLTMTVQSGITGSIPTALDAPITGFGVTPAVPQGSTHKRIEAGVPVTIDYGGAYNGYITDETRTYVIGELKEDFKKPYDAAQLIIEDFMEYAKAGIDCTEIFNRARTIEQRAGLDEYIMGYGQGKVQFIGHGI